VKQSSIHRWNNSIASMRSSSSLSLLYNQSLFSIVFQPFPDTSIYVVTDLIADKVECGECLCETKKKWEMGWKSRDITLFCCKALARCCAPCGPIWLPVSLSVVSLYVKQKEWEIGWKGRDVTLFCSRAVARYCAPSSPM
jgi:hypothetical protein